MYVPLCVCSGALVASMLVLAAVPPPSVNSAPYYDPSNSSSYTYSSMVASQGGSAAENDYEETLNKYEPWALDDESDAAGQYDMRTHTMRQE